MSECPEAFRHGPADASGRCPWCGSRYARPRPRPRLRPRPLSEATSDLRLAYEEFYDPDFGGLAPADIEHRYLMGLCP